MRAPRWLLGPAALPVVAALAVDPAGYAPFGPVKWAAVSTVVLVAWALALARGAGGLERRTARLLAAFLAWTALCAFGGVDPWYAFVGTPERHAGLLLWCLAAAAFATGQRVGHAGARPVAQSMALAAAGVGLYSTVELGWRAPIITDATTARLGGPFGSAAFLGAACCLLGPAAAGVALDRRTARPWRAVGAVGAVGTLVAGAGSGTRGAWLGAAVAAAVVAAVRRDDIGRRPEVVAAGVVAALLVAVVVATVGPRGGAGDSVVSRATPAASRLDEWRVGMRALADEPLLGVGPEGYRVVFPGLVDDAYERDYGRDVVPDRVHQSFLDVAATVGVPGLALYVALLGVVGLRVLRVLRRGDAVLAGMAAGVLAYGAQQVVLFPVAELEPVAWLAAGVLVAVDAATRPAPGRAPGARAVPVALAALAAVAAVVGGLDVAADRAVRRSFDAAGAGRPATAVAEARRAARWRPDQVRYRVAAARALTRLEPAAALAELDAAAWWSAREPALPVERAAVLDTPRAWQDALDVDPRRGSSWVSLGLAAARRGDTVTARRAWERAVALRPADPVPWLDLGRLALDEARWDDAGNAVAAAEALAPGDPRAAGLRAELRRLRGDAPR